MQPVVPILPNLSVTAMGMSIISPAYGRVRELLLYVSASGLPARRLKFFVAKPVNKLFSPKSQDFNSTINL